MNKHQESFKKNSLKVSENFVEYLKNLQKEKWVVVYGKSNGKCQHPEWESITCGEYEKSVWLTPVGGNQVVVPAGYASRSGLWICPKHISNYELTN